MIDPRTRRLLGELFEYHDLGMVQVKGLSRPVQAYEVLRASAVESRFEAFHRTALTPLIGREEEIELLLRRWQQAKAGEGQVVLLAGEPGIGKSRLVEALNERLAAEPHIRLRYFCSSQHRDSALYPVITQLERAAELRREDTPEERLTKLEAALTRNTTNDTLQADLPLLAELLLIPTGSRYAPLDLSPQKRRERTFNALITHLERLAAREPVAMLFEDVHWADPTTLDLLDLAIERVQTLPVLLIITFRPEFTPPWVGRSQVSLVTLNRLPPRQRAALIESVTGGKTLPKELSEQIIARTDGVPLFVEELTKAIVETGMLADAGDHYVLTGSLPALAIPTTLQASLMARLDRLAPVREVAQIGAALGRQFSHELIGAVAGLPPARLDAALDQLVAAELIFRRGRPPDAEYTFKHALVQDAAYETLLRSRRQQLHARIATVLEAYFPETVVAEPAVIAHHCAEAGQAEKAGSYWLKAGQQALTRSATTEAVTQLRKGLDLLATLADDPARQHKDLEFDLQVALGGALMAAKGYAHPQVVEAYERARSLATDTGRSGTMLNFSVLWGLCTANYVAGKSHAALHQAEELLSIARCQTETGPLVISHGLVGCTLIMNGDYPAALPHLKHAAALYEPVAHRGLTLQFAQDIGVRAFCYLSLALWHQGCPDEANAAAGEALRYAKESGHAHTLAYALFFSAMTAVLERRPAEVEHRANASIALADEHGFALWLGRGQVLQGWTMAQRGDGAAAVKRIREGLSAAAATGSGLWKPLLFGLLAEALALVGEIDEGLIVLAQALAAADASGQVGTDAELHRLRGDLLRHVPDLDLTECETCFRKAVEIARKQGTRGFELRAAVSLARLLGDQGRRSEAREVLAPVYTGFREGFDMPDLKDAKAALDTLS